MRQEAHAAVWMFFDQKLILKKWVSDTSQKHLGKETEEERQPHPKRVPKTYFPFSGPASCPCLHPQGCTVDLPLVCIELYCPPSCTHHLVNYINREILTLEHMCMWISLTVRKLLWTFSAHCTNQRQMWHVSLSFSWFLRSLHPGVDCSLYTRAYTDCLIASYWCIVWRRPLKSLSVKS